MTYLRSYLPNYVGDIMGYYYGMGVQMMQPYISSNYEIQHITDNIYLGNISTAVSADKLQKDGITHIISIMNGSYSMHPDKFKYKHIHINDDPWLSIDNYFDECIQFIEDCQKENGKVLIHCMCGISRSVTIIGAYLIKKNKLSFNEAITFLKNKKQTINPNDGFMNQLKKYEKKFKLF
jgi:protein-tyrosine phosphatase